MKNRNICKLITPDATKKLSTACFVLETDPMVQKKAVCLEQNRVFLTVKGEGGLLIGGKRYAVSAGSLVFAFSGEQVSAENVKDLQYMYIDFRGNRAEELFRRFDIRSHSRSYGGFDGLIPLWHESLSRASVQTVDLAAESILLYTFSRLFGNLSESSSTVSRIVELSEENFTDPELGISAVAEELGYNAKYISHLFKEKMGVGYSEYLRSLRIKYAISLLNNGIDSVKNVALLSGFSDPLYFSTVFKKTVGVAPKDYLRRSRKED